MRSKNTFYLIFWLAGCLFVLGYLCLTRRVVLDPKYIISFSTSAFGVSVASFLSQISEEFNVKKALRIILDFLAYLFMGLTMFALVVFPFVIKSINFIPVSNCLTLWSLALIFMSTVLKELKYNLLSRRKKDEEKVKEEKVKVESKLKAAAKEVQALP